MLWFPTAGVLVLFSCCHHCFKPEATHFHQWSWNGVSGKEKQTFYLCRQAVWERNTPAASSQAKAKPLASLKSFPQRTPPGCLGIPVRWSKDCFSSPCTSWAAGSWNSQLPLQQNSGSFHPCPGESQLWPLEPGNSHLSISELLAKSTCPSRSSTLAMMVALNVPWHN